MRTRFFLQSLFTNCLLLLIPLLIIGPYSVYKSTKDNTRAIRKSVSQTLNQCDNIMDSLFSHVDNANIFFSSNPRVTIQLEKAFREKSLSLDSIKNIENLSLYFQNLIFTDSYIKDIYVYYDNHNNRVYFPQRGAIQTYPMLQESAMMKSYRQAGEEDFWIEVRRPQMASPLLPSSDSLFFYQRLYTRSTHQPIGVILFEFNLNNLIKYFNELGQYNHQVLYLVDTKQNLIYTNSTSSEPQAELLSLMPLLDNNSKKTAGGSAPSSTDGSGQSMADGSIPLLSDIEIDGIPCKASYLRSDRVNGLTYFTYVPSKEIYTTSKSLSETYALLMICAVAIAFLLAFYKSNREYQYLNGIFDVFSNPEASQEFFEKLPKSATNPFEYIMLNIIRLFLQQDYLKGLDIQKEYKIQMLKMQALQHQINPHFLHNTLNSIYWESIRLTGSENSCSLMVSNLSFVMRYSLSDPQENVKIEEELNYLKKYLEIMKIRYPDKFDVEYRIDSYSAIYPIKKMILQPLVENSIYHGIKEKEGRGRICIGLKRLRHSLALYIYDNGMGISPDGLARLKKRLVSENEDADHHIGLVNTDMRLKLAYGERSALRIKSKEGEYTLVYFFLDYGKQMEGFIEKDIVADK